MHQLKVVSKEINNDVFPDLCLKKTRGWMRDLENTGKKVYFDLLKVEQNEEKFYYKVRLIGDVSHEEEQMLSRAILDELQC